MVREAIIEKLKGLGLNEIQVIEVMLLMADLERDAEKMRERRKKDREAKQDRKTSLSANLQNPKNSDEFGRKDQERMWAALLEGEDRTGSWPSKRVMKADIPADFIASWKSNQEAAHG